MESFPGPDGFLVAPDDPVRAAQLRLNDYLLAEEQRSPTTPFDLSVWRKLPKREIPAQVEAILRRYRWLDLHDKELPNAHRARMRFAALLRVLYSIKAPYSEAQLIALLELTIPLLGRIEPYGPVERVEEYLKSEHLTEGLCRSLREFQQNLREEMSISQASMQSLRQRLHMLLWMDEWEPLDPARCWSECVRRDFRTFTGAPRNRWRALLRHIRGNAPVRMPASWARGSEKLLADVGLDDFRDQIQIWFAPFRSGQPLPLSVAGSHVIKGFIWYCSVAKDDDLKECCLGLLHAKWKQKRNTEKVMVALGQFGITKEELRERGLIKPAPPAPGPRLIEKLKQAVCLRSENQIAEDGDLIVVQGQSSFYRLYKSTGRVERVSDNTELELNWEAIPDELREFLRRDSDRPARFDFRAHLLMYDLVFPNFFREKEVRGAKPARK
jgi:hypothetical protein